MTFSTFSVETRLPWIAIWSWLTWITGSIFHSHTLVLITVSFLSLFHFPFVSIPLSAMSNYPWYLYGNVINESTKVKTLGAIIMTVLYILVSLSGQQQYANAATCYTNECKGVTCSWLMNIITSCTCVYTTPLLNNILLISANFEHWENLCESVEQACCV